TTRSKASPQTGSGTQAAPSEFAAEIAPDRSSPPAPGNRHPVPALLVLVLLVPGFQRLAQAVSRRAPAQSAQAPAGAVAHTVRCRWMALPARGQTRLPASGRTLQLKRHTKIQLWARTGGR